LVLAQDAQDNVFLSSNKFKTMANKGAYNSLEDTQKAMKRESVQELGFSEVFTYNLGTYRGENNVGAADFDKNKKLLLIK